MDKDAIPTHTHPVGYYSDIKKVKSSLFSTSWVYLKGIMLTEIRQIDKDEYHMISLTCAILKNKKKQ